MQVQAVVSKAAVSKAIKTIKKENPYWIGFLHGVIEESKLDGTPVSKIVKREFKVLKTQTDLADKSKEKLTTAFIVAYANTHFDMSLRA